MGGLLTQPQEIVPVDPARLQAYTGRFLVNPDRVLTVTSEVGKLYYEPTASPKFELLPVSEDEFIRQDVNAGAREWLPDHQDLSDSLKLIELNRQRVNAV